MEGEPEQVKSGDAPVYHQGPRLVPRPRKSQCTAGRTAKHSLQVVAKEFKKI